MKPILWIIRFIQNVSMINMSQLTTLSFLLCQILILQHYFQMSEKCNEEICRQYIMQFLPPVKKRQVSAVIPTEYGDLKATSTFILDEGYKQ